MEGIAGGELWLTAAFVAYESAFAYSQFMPSLFTIKALGNEDPGKLQSLRHGEIIGTVFTGGFAVLFSCLLKSWLPLVLATISCGFVLLVYEWAIRTSPSYQGA